MCTGTSGRLSSDTTVVAPRSPSDDAGVSSMWLCESGAATVEVVQTELVIPAVLVHELWTAIAVAFAVVTGGLATAETVDLLAEDRASALLVVAVVRVMVDVVVDAVEWARISAVSSNIGGLSAAALNVSSRWIKSASSA